MGLEDEEKRARVKLEILTTERSYVADISTAIDVYMKPLLQAADDPVHAVASCDEIRLIFNNLESIWRLNQQLLQALEEENATGQSSIGQIFIEIAPFLKMYCVYVNGHSRAVEMHQELMNRQVKKDGPSRYESFITSCAEKAQDRVKNRQLTDLLIMPIQRVPRYRLLLEELLRRSPPGDEYDTIEMGLAKIADVANLVNERLRDFENRMMVLKVQDRLGNAVLLVQPHRMFVMEGALQKMCRKGPRDYIFVLFTDILVYGVGSNYSAAVYDGEQTIAFKRQIELSTSSLSAVSDTSFKLSSPSKSFVVIAPDATVRDTWFNAIQGCITSCSTRAAEIEAPTTISSANLSSGVGGDDHAPVWVQDKDAPTCQLQECGVKFTLLTRRHHCRRCGQVVCADCSPHRWLLPNIDKVKPQRICNECYLEIRSKLEEDNFESAGAQDTPHPGPPPAPRSTPSAAASSMFQIRTPSGIFSRILKVSGSTSGPRLPSLPRSFLSSEKESPSPAATNASPSVPTREARKSALGAEASGEDLPRNWRVLKDEHGKTYYWHVITDLVQYERPTGKVKTHQWQREGDSSSGSQTPPMQRSASSAAAKQTSPLKPSSPKGSDQKSGLSSTKSSVPVNAASALRKSEQQLPPGSPVLVSQPRALSPKGGQVPALPKLNGPASAARRRSMMGPSLADRLASLNEQGVFGDPKLAKFSTAKRPVKPMNSSPLLSPRNNSSNWARMAGSDAGTLATSQGQQSKLPSPQNGSRSASSDGGSLASSSKVPSPQNNTRSAGSDGGGLSIGSTFKGQQTNGAARPASGTGQQSSSRATSPRPVSQGFELKPSARQTPQSFEPKQSPRPVSQAYELKQSSRPVSQGYELKQNTKPTSQGYELKQTRAANDGQQQTQGKSDQQRFASSNGGPAPVNVSAGRVDVSKLTDGEFFKVMGVRRSEFDQFPAYKKVQLKQTKNVM